MEFENLFKLVIQLDKWLECKAYEMKLIIFLKLEKLNYEQIYDEW